MAVSSFPQNLLVPLYGQEVAAWSGHERQFFDRVPNEIATDVLNGWIVTESLGYDGQRGLSLILDAVNGFRRTKHFIRRTFLDRPQLENVRIHECASIDWAKEKVTIEPNLDCRQIAYVIWLSTLPMFVPIEERLDVSRSPWSFGFSRETFLQYWLDLAASIIVNSGLDMTLRLPIARWLLSKSLPIDLIHRYLSWLRFCAEKYCRDTYKFDDWKLGRFGLGNQLLVAASEKNPPALFRFAEARLEGAVRRAITTTPRSRNEPMSTEERANHVFSAMTTSSFRL